MNQFIRTELLLGKDKMNKLYNAKIIIFGVGGVGGFVCEALARSGVSNFTLVDKDTVSISNINRQIIASFDSIGKYKVDLMKERILSFNKNAKVAVKKAFITKDNLAEFDFKEFDYVIDCIDTISTKIEIACKAYNDNIRVISAMGAGNKLNPQGFMVTDIYKTEMDPLAKVLRYELRKRGVKKLKVVYSKEKPLKQDYPLYDSESGKVVPGSNAWVPASAGLLIASAVVEDLTK